MTFASLRRYRDRSMAAPRTNALTDCPARTAARSIRIFCSAGSRRSSRSSLIEAAIGLSCSPSVLHDLSQGYYRCRTENVHTNNMRSSGIPGGCVRPADLGYNSLKVPRFPSLNACFPRIVNPRTMVQIQNLIDDVKDFAALHEIERCVLEPGGTFSIVGKKPREAVRQHEELLERLDHLSRQIEELKGQLTP